MSLRRRLLSDSARSLKTWLNRIHFAVEHSTTIENTFATQWVATAPFFAEPYKGSDAYITHDGFMQAMVTCVRRRRWNFRGYGKFQGRQVDTHGSVRRHRAEPCSLTPAFHALTELLQRSGMCRQASSVLPLFFSRPVRLGPLAPFHCRASAPRSLQSSDPQQRRPMPQPRRVSCGWPSLPSSSHRRQSPGPANAWRPTSSRLMPCSCRTSNASASRLRQHCAAQWRKLWRDG